MCTFSVINNIPVLMAVFVFQSGNSKKWSQRERHSRQSRSDRPHTDQRGQKAVSGAMTDQGRENINPAEDIATSSKRRLTLAGPCQPLHPLTCINNNNNNNKFVIRKYHFSNDSINLSDDEGIGSAESLTSNPDES